MLKSVIAPPSHAVPYTTGNLLSVAGGSCCRLPGFGDAPAAPDVSLLCDPPSILKDGAFGARTLEMITDTAMLIAAAIIIVPAPTSAKTVTPVINIAIVMPNAKASTA